LFGSLGAGINKWYNLINGGDGNLYGIPNNADEVLEVTPATQGTNTYAGAVSPIATTIKWPDAVLAGNGKIYGIPNRAQDVLEFDITTKGISLFGGFADNVTKWGKGVLADNGLIYASPVGSGTTVLEINPTTQGTVEYDTGVVTTANWNHIEHVDGKVYLIPLNNPSVYVFDTVTKTFTTLGNFTDTSKWNHAVTVGTKIFCIPRKVTYSMVIDTEKQSVRTFGNVGDSSDDLQWNKGVLADNGKIYAFPAYQNTTILEIDPDNETMIEFGNLTNSEDFSWPYAVKANNGNIYGVPSSVDYEAYLIPE
jgi:hypothetical protein